MVAFPVQLSDTVKNNRWAAEFYRPGFSFEPIDPSEWCKIRQITSDRQYGMSLVMNQEGRGFPIYRLNEIDNCFLSEVPEKCADVSRREAAPFFMKDGDVLFCRTNGNINYVGRTGIWYGSEEMVFASYLVKVRTKQNELSPEYLTVYLNTAFGRRQIVRRAMPSNQVNVSASELMKVDIYVPHAEIQKEISGFVRKAYKVRKVALRDYSSAKALLSSALKEGELKFNHALSYTTKFSDVMREGRTDADYFQVPYMQVKKHLDRLETVPLSSLVDFVKGVEVGSDAYIECGKLFMRVSNLTERGMKSNASDKYISDGLYQSLASAFQPKHGELLLTKDGTPGICWVVFRPCECIISSAIVRLLPKKSDVPPEYLALAINSTLCRMQVEQQASGALILHWKLPLIKKLRIPLCDKDTMKEIARLVKESKRQQYKSESLLAAAKSRVEELIESAVKGRMDG